MAVRSRAYAWYVLGLLTLINFVNYLDRTVLIGLYDDLRRHFPGLTDSHLGLLTGTFFAVHGLTTLPFAWAADRFDRRKIIAFGVIAWSLATVAAAYSTGFAMLLILRSLVGIGEAAYGPASITMICELFRQDEKARTAAIYNCGMFIGGCVGIYLGGTLGFPLAFQVVGIPGIVLGLMALPLKVAPRRVDVEPGLERAGIREVFVSGFAALYRVRTMRWMTGTGILISFVAGADIAWFAEFIIRYKGMTKEVAYPILAVICLSAGGLGAVVGGIVADRFMRTNPNGRIKAIGLSQALSIPVCLGTIYIDRGLGFFVSAWLTMFFLPWYNGPMQAIVDDVVADKQAARAQAAYAGVQHILGTAAAPVIVGWVSDHVGLRTALLLPVAATAGAALFCVAGARHVAADMRAQGRLPAEEGDSSLPFPVPAERPAPSRAAAS